MLERGASANERGGRAHLVCPPAIAYGMRSHPGIPPGSTLVFDVQLISVRTASPTPTVADFDEEKIAKALAIVAGVWLLRKVGDAASAAHGSEMVPPPKPEACDFKVLRTSNGGRSVEYECSNSNDGWLRLEKDGHWYEVGPLGTLPSASRGRDLVKALGIVCGC